jgi:hypothetical protein
LSEYPLNRIGRNYEEIIRFYRPGHGSCFGHGGYRNGANFWYRQRYRQRLRLRRQLSMWQ